MTKIQLIIEREREREKQEGIQSREEKNGKKLCNRVNFSEWNYINNKRVNKIVMINKERKKIKKILPIGIKKQKKTIRK